ncbi:glycosyltransferase family 2 protein [uncultured Shewanella sp.]|uniref:glycosyltransferase family 2 protein n=1 Tax=uncultured Shewanella sp. TaxID=173975 RepID=UPI00261AED93|nr:glycosyltransferase family 2 protein [uncultured Shewanella sp.]
MLISVVAPMYNEASAINEYITQTITVLKKNYDAFELIIVDDGSTDKSVNIVQHSMSVYAEIRLIILSRNFGHENALTAGLVAAKGDFVVLMDSDLQNPPQLIPKLFKKLNEGFDVVYAARTHRKGESWLKKTSSYFFYWLAKKMTGFELSADAADFRILHRRVVDALILLKENNRKLIMLYAFVGFNTASVPYHVPPRFAGKSKYNYFQLIKTALDAILSFSTRPLWIISILSIIISFLSASYAGFIFLQHFIVNNLIDGVASILCFTATMFSILFLFLSLLSEYIGRIMTETKSRPLYYIQREICHDDLNIDANQKRE